MAKTEQKSKIELRLEAYQHAINKIDDYFEYDLGEFVANGLAAALGLPPKYIVSKRTYEDAKETVGKILDEQTGNYN